VICAPWSLRTWLRLVNGMASSRFWIARVVGIFRSLFACTELGAPQSLRKTRGGSVRVRCSGWRIRGEGAAILGSILRIEGVVSLFLECCDRDVRPAQAVEVQQHEL
jgi:hypothetical protein